MLTAKQRRYSSLLILVLILLAAGAAQASTRVSLDGYWRFKSDPAGQGEAAGWAQKIPGQTETVRVPGTWSLLRKYYNYIGPAWYFKTFNAPPARTGERVEIHFGATFYKSRVWLNGHELGGHEGGYTEYYFNLTPYLKAVNFLAVEIDNRGGMATIPGWAMKYSTPQNKQWYDWWPQGGIIRDVWLKLSAPQLLRWQLIRSAVSGANATVTDQLHLENHSASAARAVLTLSAIAADGSLAATATRQLSLAPGSSVETISLNLPDAKLWSFDNPNLYRMRVRLADSGGGTLDSLACNFGVRTIEIRCRRLYLNGQAVRLSGIDRHEDSPWEGVAETEGTIRHDFDDMKNLQVTLTRPVHYPQNPRVYDYCDRHGILLIPEIPVWEFDAKQLANPRVLQLAEQMMREVIEQDGNHPSIFAWSVMNECTTDTPAGVAYFRHMREFIRKLDPSRFVTYADDTLPKVTDPAGNAATYADFVMWNEYYGSGHGPEQLLPEMIRKIGNDYPDKMVIISESAPWTPITKNPVEANRFRNRSIGRALALFGKYPWIGGVLYWCYSPYRSRAHMPETKLNWPIPQSERGQSNFNFVDQNRQREPIYAAFRKYNSPAGLDLAFDWLAGEKPSAPPAGFHATISRRGADQIPSYPLDHYRAVWRAVDQQGREIASGEEKLPDIGPPHQLEGHWQRPGGLREMTLHFWLYRPTGFLAAESTCRWEPGIWRNGLWRCTSGFQN